MSSGPVHLRSSLRVALVLASLYVLLVLVVLTLPGAVLARPGELGARAISASLAVLSWAAAGWSGTRQLRAAGPSRTRTAATAGVGGALGYALAPGLLGTAGLLLSGAGAGALAGGPLLSTLAAGAVSAVAAGVSPHAPPPVPYSA